MRTFLRALAIALAAAWVYGPCLHGTWLWDDGLEITQNAALRDPGGWWLPWVHPGGMDYFPLKGSVQWAMWQLWGASPFGFHLANLALHVLSSLLVWRLLHVLGLRGAFLGGLVFAVHPLAVESVAWISELKNTLSLPPLLLSAIALVAFYRSGSRAAWVLSLLSFAAALACKTSVVMFPFCILLYAWWLHRRITGRDLRKAAPFFAASLAMGLATLHFQSARAIGASAPAAPLGERAAQAGASVLAYLRQALWPSGLAPIYPPAPGPAAGWAAWAALAAVLGLLWWRRGDWGRHALLGLGWFLLNLVPVLGLLPMAYSRISPRADHFAYLPLVGLVGLFVAGLGAVQSRWERLVPGRAVPRLGVTLAATAAAIALAFTARAQAASFASEKALWTTAVARNPISWLARSNLGRVLLEEGRTAEAERELREAVRLGPASAEAEADLGNALDRLGRADEARAHYARAVGIDPSLAGAHFNFGLSLLRAGRASEASGQFRAALAIEPGRAAAHNGLGLSLAALGLRKEAAAEYRRAVELDPGLKEARLNLGNALFRAGRLEEAVAEYRRAISIDPGYSGAHYNLAQALQALGRQDEAASELALSRGPANR